ncbi:peptidoglycan-binding domain-containing protein [Rhodanobacter sp. L36]|uniref:peptidoglycan-binding domain-containing protein n=1 Tax=Rhodanobacter sp. L36 TaxID=1747221 RepID=UPI00131CE516|nr:peptidoglycan-binding domain-containing protein [Rhodanobacter sp. L36]
MPDYFVSAGESLASIAKDNGYLWKTLWEHGNNAGLRGQRKNPNQLVEGDKLFLPDKAAKNISKPTDAKHKFKRKGEPTSIKMQLTSLGNPRKNEPYTLTFGDKVIHGTTDAEGKFEQPIPGEVKSATLMLSSGKEVYNVAIGMLDPSSLTNGVRQRLSNLGYDCGGDDGDELGDATRAALARFQNDNNIKATGDLDDATRAKIDQLHV